MLFFYTLSLALLAFASAQEEEPCSQAAMDIRDAANETLQVALNNSMDAAVALVAEKAAKKKPAKKKAAAKKKPAAKKKTAAKKKADAAEG